MFVTFCVQIHLYINMYMLKLHFDTTTFAEPPLTGLFSMTQRMFVMHASHVASLCRQTANLYYFHTVFIMHPLK